MTGYKEKHVLNLKDDAYGQICIYCSETTNNSKDGVEAKASERSDEVCLDSIIIGNILQK
ncbi:MAG TPA: hypothetical protein ENO00_04380 [Deltaproteobacteria bacterium]|nr:hypothetical protein [Deltaproteobacteria bacterium]